jgi:hypothetical protein
MDAGQILSLGRRPRHEPDSIETHQPLRSCYPQKPVGGLSNICATWPLAITALNVTRLRSGGARSAILTQFRFRISASDQKRLCSARPTSVSTPLACPYCVSFELEVEVA